jgi:hypothetical protein
MEIVGFIEMPTELSREQLAHRGFASAGDPADYYDHDALICRGRPILSTRNTTTTNNV